MVSVVSTYVAGVGRDGRLQMGGYSHVGIGEGVLQVGVSGIVFMACLSADEGPAVSYSISRIYHAHRGLYTPNYNFFSTNFIL